MQKSWYLASVFLISPGTNNFQRYWQMIFIKRYITQIMIIRWNIWRSKATRIQYPNWYYLNGLNGSSLLRLKINILFLIPLY